MHWCITSWWCFLLAVFMAKAGSYNMCILWWWYIMGCSMGVLF